MDNHTDKLTENTEFQPIQLAVNSTKLHHSSEDWKPEMEKLSAKVADEIEHRLPNLRIGEEVLVTEISGFPGLSQVENGRSSEAIGTSNIGRLAPDEIIKLLQSKGIPAEFSYNENYKPKKADTKVIVRQFHDHDESSYGMDQHPPAGGSTSSYQKSKLQYFIRPIEPQEAEPPIVLNTNRASVASGIRIVINRVWRRLTG